MGRETKDAVCKQNQVKVRKPAAVNRILKKFPTPVKHGDMHVVHTEAAIRLALPVRTLTRSREYGEC